MSPNLPAPSTKFESEDGQQPHEPRNQPKKRGKRCKTAREQDDTMDASVERITAGSKKVRRGRGKLSRMMDMPVDIFPEIARHLSPHDLLRLSRTTKRLRELLMSKRTAKETWTAAEQVESQAVGGYPPCSADMSSPQLASFLYDSFCMGCYRRRGLCKLVPFRMRVCKPCMEGNVKTVDQLMAGLRNALLDGLDMSSEFFNLVPAKVPAKETYYQPTPSLDGENIDKLGFCENLYRMTGIRPSTAGACEYYMPHFVDALMQYASFGSNRLDRENFVVEQARLTGVVHMSVPALEGWISRSKVARTREIRALKKNRRESVIAKLKEMRYTLVDLSTTYDESAWRWDSIIDRPQLLTDRVWKKLLPKLEKTRQLRKAGREERDRKARISAQEKRIFAVARDVVGNECYLVTSDVCGLPLAKKLIYRDDSRYRVTEDDLELLSQEMKQLNEDRLRVALEEGAEELSRVRRGYGLEDVPADIMQDELEPRKNVWKALLFHPTSFCEPYDRLGFGNDFKHTYSEILDMIFDRHIDSLSTLNSFRLTSTEPLQAYKAAAKSQFLAANALFTSLALALGAKTMANANAMGTSFVCLRCHRACRQLLSWKKLVLHYAQNYNDFEKRDSEPKRLESAANFAIRAVDNVNDHDINRPEALAVYTGVLKVEDATEWIKPRT